MNKKIKVLITGNIFFGLKKDGALGGIESFACRLFEMMLKDDRFDPYLLCPLDSEYDHPSVIKWDAYSKEYMYQHGLGNRYDTMKIVEKIREIAPMDFDLVVDNFTNMRIVRAMLELCAPIVHVCHTIMFYRNAQEYHEKLLDQKMRNPHFHVVAVSKYVMDNLNNSIPGVVDGVLSPDYTEIDHGYTATPDDYFVYVGRLSREKYVDVIIKSFAASGEKLKLIGPQVNNPDSEVEWFNTQIQPILDAHPNIEVCGPIYPPHLFEVVGRSIASVSSCFDEAFPLGLFESQKLGVPLMVRKSKNDFGVHEYMIEGVTGVSVDTYKMREARMIESMVQGIAEVKKIGTDTDRRQFIYDHFQETYGEKQYLDKFCKMFNII